MFLALFIGLATAAVPSNAVIVDARDNITEAHAFEIAQDAGLSDIKWVDATSADERLLIGVAADPVDALSRLRGNAEVEATEQPIQYSMLGTFEAAPVNDPAWKQQWHLRSMDAEWVWKNTTSGDGIVVAVLDTGISVTKDVDPSRMHPSKRNFTDSKTTDDWVGHGTHCAGSIGQWTDNGYGAAGLAKNATLMNVKVLSDEGYGYNHWIAAGIDYAVEQGAEVISMSLGGSQSSDVINRAIDDAIAHGVVVVAASGNDGRGRVGFPAGYDPVIAIGSYGPDSKIAYYSNWGPGLDLMAPGGNKQIKDGGVFQITAPGGVEQLAEWQGTSMATPHAAAAVAILLGEGVADADIEATLKATAKSPPSGENKDKYAAGLIDIKAAVKKAKGANTASALPVHASALPWPSPAGPLSYGVIAVALATLVLMRRFYGFSPRFLYVTGATAVLSSGPLFALSYLKLDLPGLALLMVPWVELPEFIFGAGITGCPLWLSPLPMIIPFLLMIPIGRLRLIAIGLTTSLFSYLLLNSFLGFNHLWWVSAFGSSAWLGISALCLLAMNMVASEFHVKSGDDV